MISGSSLNRVKACPASEAYPHRDSITEDSDKGNVRHQYLCDVSIMGKDEALDRVPEEYRGLCELIDLSRLPACKPNEFQPEISFVFDVRTGKARYLGQNLKRNYGELKPGEIPLTLDNICLAADGETAIVTDYKSGWSDAPRADVNLQLKIGALCAARYFDVKKVHVSIIRLKDDGSSWYDNADFGKWDLSVIAGEVTSIYDAALATRLKHDSGGDIKPVMGTHCRYCPAFAHCPAVSKLAVTLSSGVELSEINLTPENAAEAYHKVKVAKKLLAEVEKSVKKIAKDHPIDLGDGTMLGEVDWPTTSVQGGVALRVLRKRFGDDAADGACEIKTSKKKIEDVLRPIAKAREGVTLKSLRESVLGEVEELGGIKKKITKQIRPHKPRIEAK